MTKKEIAISKFTDGYNCSQSVLYSFCDFLNFDPDLALKISCGFGAGMGRKEEVCGAISGGIMILGLLYGRENNQESTLTEDTYSKTKYLIDQFTEKQGTISCRKLLDDCNLTTPEGQEEFKKKDLYNKVCKRCVGNVVNILEDIIENN
ncbi:MAG: C-GCAxxG-C-C family protein [Bacillota bacterium]